LFDRVSYFAQRLLDAGGETGALIARHDWSATSLGSTEGWSQSLRTATELMLRSPVPLVMLWGEDGVMLYNDAYSVFAGGRHPELLGSKVREGWPEVTDFNDNVMKVGLAGGTLSYKDQELTLHRHGCPEQVFMNLDYSPVPGDDGQPAGVLAIVVETSERVRTERRQAFRLDLKERLRELTDPRAVMDAAVEALGRHLGANRVGYSEVLPDDETIALASCYAEGVEPLHGTFNLDAFGPESIVRQREGQVEVCDDVLADPRQVYATWEAIDTRAFMSVPLVRGGRFTASLYLNFREAHAWTADEVALVEDVAARTWEAVERARAEAALRESEGRFRLTTDAVPQIVWITDADGRTEYFSRQWTEYTGEPYEQSTAADIAASYVHPDDQARTMTAFEEARRTGGVFEVEHRVRSKAGEHRWFLVRAEPYRDPRTGEIVRWYGGSTDIHDLKTAEASLLASETRYRQIVEGAEDFAIMVLDEHGVVTTWNSGAERVTGFGEDEAIGRIGDFFFTTEDRAAMVPDHELNRAKADGRSLNERWHVRKDGTRFWASGLTMRLDHPGGGYLKIFRDRTAEHEADAAMRESEARFREIADAAPVLIWISDTSKACTWFNRPWLDFTGRSMDEEYGYGWAEGVHPDDFDRCVATYNQAFDRREPFRMDYRLRRHDGEWRMLDDTGVPRFAHDRTFLGYIGSCVDVTEQRTAEAALRRSEEQLRLATEAAEVGLWDLDPQSDTLFWPPRVKAMFGVSPDRPISMADFYAGLHPDDAQATSEAFAAAVDPERRARYDVEYRTIGKEDGVVRWVAAKGRGVFDADGRCVRVIGTAIDITARKAIEEQLRELNETLETRVVERTAELVESERRFRGIFDSALQFMALLAPDGTVIEVNQTALAWSEIETEEIVGKPFWLAAPMRDNPALQQAIETGVRRAAAGETVREEHEMRGAGEVRAVVDFSLKPVPGDGGQPIWLVAEGRDITELKQAQDALRQAQKMEAVGQLTGGIAHDFNNLLGAVVGSLDLIRRKPTDTDRVRRYAEAGLQAAERGAKLTGQLLAFSRAQRLEQKPVVVSALLAGMRDMLDRSLGPLVKLTLELSGDGAALSDPTQLEVAVLNLAINARDAMPDGGELTIATAPRELRADPELKAGEYVEVSVRDTGTGMSPEVAARAFDPFFTTKGVGKGTGLGLSQIYGLARQTGGTVRIESQPGQGTTVRILLPKTSLPAQPAAKAGVNGPDASGAAATILVVDDDPDIRRVLVDSLEALGYRVIEAPDGPAGLSELERSAPDLMMVDFAMPSMNGAEVARAARERRPDLPILFASGYADTAAIEEAAGKDAIILRKPFRVDDLQAVLVEALSGTN
jgi:PAS domain S-box-containing protein